MSNDGKSIHELDLHEAHTITSTREEYIGVMRVPGGWIYEHENGSGAISTTFVPLSPEFAPNVSAMYPRVDADLP